MKVQLENIILNNGESFLCSYQDTTSTQESDYWHFHPEFEIAYIPKGNGQRFIGGKITNYKDGDLIVVAPNIPHNSFHFGHKSSEYEEYCIHFDTKSFLDKLHQFQELKHIDDFIKRVKSTLVIFTDEQKQYIGDDIVQMFKLEPAERLLHFIAILKKMSETSKGVESHIYFNSTPLLDAAKIKRINKVYKTLETKYALELTTKQVSLELGLTPSAFCKFFKRHVGKTFKQALTEVRIQNACKLLVTSDNPISSIAYDCGFNSISLFNRLFKKNTGKTPKAYRKGILIS